MEFGKPTPKNDLKKPNWMYPCKIVNHPISGRVDVCPFPETHFDELSREAERLRYPTTIKKY